MLTKTALVTVTPATPGQAGRDASYECSAYDSGGPVDDGDPVPPTDPGIDEGVSFSGVGTPYVPVAGEWVYLGEGSSWEAHEVGDPEDYSCVWGTSDPIETPDGPTTITAPFCSFSG